MDKKTAQILADSFLFLGLDTDESVELLESIDTEIRKFKKGEVIYSPDSFEKKLGIVIEGKCVIERIHTDGKRIPLNELGQSESFGVLATFSGSDEFPSYVGALSDCTVAFISAETVKRRLLSNPEIALNIINFMSEKISFLNDKISTFSGYNVEQKVASYVLNKRKKSGLDSFDFNKKRCAESIGAGRASLYRAIDKLAALGLISFDDKKINIIDRKGLERISK